MLVRTEKSTYFCRKDWKSMITATYSELRANLKTYLDRVVQDCDDVLVSRPGGEAVVIISFADYQAYKETAYILSRPDIMDDIRQGEEDIRKGNVTDLDFDELHSKIDTAGKA